MKKTILATALSALLVAGAYGAGQEGASGAASGAPGTGGSGMSPLSEGTWWATLSAYEADTGNQIAAFTDAPMLAQAVADGTLPPVADRLPDEPMVVQPFESIGRHGGTLNLVKQFDDFWGAGSYMHLETMLGRGRPDVDRVVIPNIAHDWEYTDGSRRLTLFLREGHRWSDGSPFTPDDFLFWYDDLILNEEYTPVISRRWYVNDELMKMSKVDDTTVQFDFAGPWPGLIYNLSGGATGIIMRSPYAPSAYLKQFHPDYNDNAADLAKEAGFDTWFQHLRNRARYNDDEAVVGVPLLSAWIPETVEIDFVIQTRNPYYHKIDPAGNQLPYIDRLRSQLAGDTELIAARVISGQSDYGAGIYGGGVSVAKLPVLLSRAEQNNLRVSVAPTPTSWGALEVGLFFNNTVPDPVLRELFADVRFKQALSLALDRDEINDLVFAGLGKPSLATVQSNSPWYDEQTATEFAVYDPERAMQLMDEIGLAVDADGNRIRPDGAPLEIILTIAPFVPSHAPSAELIADHWSAVGVPTTIDQTAGGEMWQKYSANESMLSLWQLDESDYGRTVGSLQWWAGGQFWGREWQRWRQTAGAEGEEPPAEVQEYFATWSQLPIVTDDAERIEYGRRAIALLGENLWYIGVMAPPPDVRYARANLRNIDLEHLPHLQYAPAAAFQWYLDE